MVNVMVISVITTEHLEWVEGESITAVIIDRFHGTEREQENCLSNREVGNSLRHHGTDTVEQKSLEGVIVQCAERVGYIKAVMHGMEVLVKEFVRVHPAVKEILPTVDDESIEHPTEMKEQLGERRGDSQGEEDLCSGYAPPV